MGLVAIQFHLKGATQEQIKAAAAACFSAPALVSNAVDGWISIAEERFTGDVDTLIEKTALYSKQFSTLVVSFLEFDDFAFMTFSDCGNVQGSHMFPGSIDSAQETSSPYACDPAVLARHCIPGTNAADLSMLLNTFSPDRLMLMGAALGIPQSRIGFSYTRTPADPNFILLP